MTTRPPADGGEAPSEAPPADAVARRITAWFAREARDLPWRREPTPYHVLLSELMLQQTRVETVIPYFERFVARWPTIDALAAADDDEVLREWAGLGYYARARNLLAAARAAVDAGGLPDDVERLQGLPGIGPYTAGALASIAYGVAAPLVDGNVERVLSRLDARAENPRREGRAALWTRVEALLAALPDDAHPGALNQGLMELGATVCTPRAPRCAACPVTELCLARDDDPEQLPRKAPKAPPREVRAVAAVVRTDAGFVLGRRPPGLLGGMWEPVGTDLDPDADPVDAVRAAYAERARCEVVELRPLGEVVHVFTHRRQTTTVYEGRLVGVPTTGTYYTDVRLVADLETVALSTRARRVLALWARPGLPL